ncbi:unnamed protein product [Ilex paraguariensis]|uniref:Histone-lysine N-methyltransferase SUVR3 n=1 Tax=Ilex paraguariensis TaxID=185542 RepID=A0ABC8S731_9AQUA
MDNFLPQNSRFRMEKRSRSSYQEHETATPALIHCAEHILPWLHPTELACISSTCKILHQISQAITSRRISDASRTLEKCPIPFINTIDHNLYSFFIYTSAQTLGLAEPSRLRQPWGSKPGTRPDSSVDRPEPILVCVEGACGCGCDERCDGDSGCPCFSGCDSDELSRECGLTCGCGLDCGNRLTQRGVTMRLKIVKDKRKGWGLHAGQLIREGQFVCEYAVHPSLSLRIAAIYCS